jgi:hypothetical protein
MVRLWFLSLPWRVVIHLQIAAFALKLSLAIYRSQGFEKRVFWAWFSDGYRMIASASASVG